MKEYRITLNGRIYDIQLLSDPRRSPVELVIDGETVTAEIEATSVVQETVESATVLAPSRPPSAPSATASAQTIAVPLPGVIKSVAVQPGQQVAAGDELLTIEAMKMDNVIRAPQAGTLDAVHVAEGQRVAHGQPMIEYRP